MNPTHHDPSAVHTLEFHVNLANPWERQYLARRLGVSEEALLLSSPSDEPSVEEIIDSFCPAASARKSHAQWHLDGIAETATGAQPGS